MTDLQHQPVGRVPEIDAVDFYTRPGCAVSAMLWRGLHRRGIALRAHDIWADPDAAARVRAAARGNETVPTVAIGTTVLVNPRVADVVAALELHAPHLVGAPPEPGAWRRRWRSLTSRSEPYR
jgi:glutaredoxin